MYVAAECSVTNAVINAKCSYHLQQLSLAENNLFSFERGQTLGKWNMTRAMIISMSLQKMLKRWETYVTERSKNTIRGKL